jgi:iron(III) transport system substrate-binding protein
MAILVASVAAGAHHPNAAKLFVDFLISDDGQKLFRDRGYIPVAPAIPPRESKLRPDGKTFRGIFFTPEEIDMSMPRWMKIFNEVFS